MPVTKPYEASGRTNQKLRTRRALIAAARDLVARGITPTVEQAAEAAAISRTTAYRYFPTRQALLGTAHAETMRASLLPKHAPEDPVERFRIVVRAYLRILVRTERQQRTMLRLSLEDSTPQRDLPLRKGRMIGWIEDALAPLREKIGASALRKVAIAVRSATGIEAFVWLVDVAGIKRARCIAMMQWTADALLAAALAEHGIHVAVPPLPRLR